MHAMETPNPNASTPQAYIELVQSRLAQRGFGFEAGPNGILVAHKSGFSITKFGNADELVVLSYLPKLEPADYGSFMASCYDFGLRSIRGFRMPRGFGQFVSCTTVAILDSAPVELTDLTQKEPPKHWSAMESRVIRDLSRATTYSYQGVRVFGAAYMASQRAFVREVLG
jgi:hypothetical protein